MTREIAKLLPFYLVIDVSASMAGEKLRSAGAIMPKVVDALGQDPILGDKVRFGLIDFAGDARIRLPLCDLLDPNLSLPDLQIRDFTSYKAAFILLRKEIEANVTQLKADGYAVHRPAVFFLSDGEPTDKPDVWRTALADLTRSAMYPNIIPCGVDKANPRTLRDLIHPATGDKQMQMYLMDKGEDAAKAITAIAEVLISSMLASGQSMAAGGSGIILPDREDIPAGITPHNAADYL